MEVTIDSQPIACSSENLESFNQWWKNVTSDIFQKGRLLYQVSVDGIPFYDGYETQIIQHFDRIKTIDIYTKSKEEAFQESVQELIGYNRKLIDATDRVSGAFYGEPDSEQWSLFAQYIEGMQWLSQSLHFVQAISAEKEQYSDLQQSITEILDMMSEKVQMLDHASDDKDYTLMGDVIQYELSDVLHKIEQVFGGLQ